MHNTSSLKCQTDVIPPKQVVVEKVYLFGRSDQLEAMKDIKYQRVKILEYDARVIKRYS